MYKFKNVDSIYYLVLFSLSFFTYSFIRDSHINTESPNANYIYIEVEKQGEASIIYKINKNTRHYSIPNLSLSHTDIINGSKYIVDQNNEVLNKSAISGKHKIALGIPININSANIYDLMHLPGIGPKTADKIIYYRNTYGTFKSVQQIIKIKGIGQKKYLAIRPFISID